MIKYEDRIRPVDTITCSAWQIKIKATSEVRVLVAAPEFDILGIIEMEKNYIKEDFMVQRIDCGSFIISKVEDAYSGDAIWVDKDHNVLVGED